MGDAVGGGMGAGNNYSPAVSWCFFLRNVLVESARIARGAISPLSQLQVDQFAAVVFPGGFGAAKNL